jgi:hypothetical protein
VGSKLARKLAEVVKTASLTKEDAAFRATRVDLPAGKLIVV